MSNETRRRQAAALAGHEGDEKTARAFLSDAAGAVRASALTALARMHHLNEDDVRSALADPEPVARHRAIALAIPFSDIDVVPLLHDVDVSVVEQAAWALGERGNIAGHHAVETLASVATNHDDPLCREAAVAALGAIGDASALPAILSAMHDKPAVRRRAVLALAPFEGPEVDAALTRAKEDRDWQVRQAAEDMSD